MLQDKWSSLWLRAGGRENCWLRPYERLLLRYAEPHRRYHTLAHVQHCLREFDAIRDLADHADSVEMAVWFHDAIYDTRAKDSEARSAELARNVLDVGGFREEFGDRVAELVMATSHASPPTFNDAALLVEADLAILGQPEAVFDEYERGIRREYAWVDDASFAAARAAALESFLRRPVIFAVHSLHDAYEAAARANLARSIDRLRRGEIIS
ncbi:MAG TPA: N-methyl-D-aspartate receptor NMDAR2C subunit [Patescibacteria group bacterium]|nr:N-methyl-D-aspartate receptor NMDAR2C subunit [Patescibacteria group bacterium]